MQYDALWYGSQFSIGGITINGSTDTNGCDWILTKEDGWFGSPAVKAIRNDKPASRGVFRGVEYRGARVIVLEGTLSAPSVATLQNAIDTLSAVCPDPKSLYPLTVTSANSARYINVALDAPITTTPISWQSVAFSLQLMAPDLRKLDNSLTTLSTGLTTAGTGGVSYPVTYPVNYGTPGSGGSLVVTNTGTADADMTFTLAGALTTPTITRADTGDTLTYNATLSSTDSVVINTNTGAVTQGGINRRALLTANNWFSIPAQSSITIQFRSGSPGDTGTLTVSYRNTWY
ncbi:phage distal tail protein [Kutzneria albida]|uniref:Siphovirus-type tail component C-terminal domain-containing protein n=1 Tax=Kutzneria albida DSM 43870 TaxID=1449976 RepID=W5WCQ4_9PSEU|nr:phage tail domain-containing protein [Kutzneria albida]AHH98336.1 hypothetical protein KALB_4974 [Kutzneria albida DSM 43870]